MAFGPPGLLGWIELDVELNAQGTSLVVAELKDGVRAKIQRYELTSQFDPRHFYRTIDAAVAAYMAETGAEWSTGD